jgi:hypothetical protein
MVTALPASFAPSAKAAANLSVDDILRGEPARTTMFLLTKQFPLIIDLLKILVFVLSTINQHSNNMPTHCFLKPDTYFSVQRFL